MASSGNYEVGQWTGSDWIARVHRLKKVLKRAPCNTLVYLWPADKWVWASEITVTPHAVKLPAISVDTDGVRVKLALLLLRYSKPAWVAKEVGVSRPAISWLQNNRGLDRWTYLPSIEQIRADIEGGMKIRQMCEVYGTALGALHTYLTAHGVSYEEMVRERDDRRRSMGLPPLRGGGRSKKQGAKLDSDPGIQAQ